MGDKVLITGGQGMLGQYLLEEFREFEIQTLGLKETNTIIADLSKDSPKMGDVKFDTVIHTAGTEDERYAMPLNLEGTKRLLQALESFPPNNFVYISSYRVYSRDAGNDITEDTNLWASDETGKSKALAEKYVEDWCKERGVVLTIIRPAMMFGKGVRGETLTLFNDAIGGKYIHIRGNDANVSIVTAYDVAKAIKKIYRIGGIYNASDGRNPRLIDLVESMTANAGAKKRMTHLPLAWAEWVWRLGRWVPSIDRNLSPKVVEARMKTLTIDGSKLSQITGLKYHDTILVMEHEDKNYPYSYLEKKEIGNMAEV